MTHAEYELALAEARKEPDPMLAAGLTIAASVERLDTIADEAQAALGRAEALPRRAKLAREGAAAQGLDPYAPRENECKLKRLVERSDRRTDERDR